MILLWMTLGLLALLALRVPVGFALLVPSLAYVVFDPTASLRIAVQQTVSGVDTFPLLAVPMFILLGNLANASGMTDRVYAAALAFLAHIRGSLGYVNVATSFGFSWMSGTAMADAAAMGRVQAPAMIARGYPAPFTLGVTGASSLISPLIPPSIPAILYATTAGVSVGAMFVAGILPALLLVAALCLMVWWQMRKKEHLREPRSGWPARMRALLAALPAAGAAVIILGGILSGVTTPTEASAAGVLYLFVVALVTRAIDGRALYTVLLRTVETSGAVLLVIASAALFGWVLARERTPQAAADLMLGLTDHPLAFLALVCVLLFVVGAVLEPGAAILIVVPVLAPIADGYGIDPLHFAVVVILTLIIGLLTPPVGLVLFVLSGVTGESVPTVIRGVLPFFVPMVTVLLFVVLVPSLSTWLPSALGFL
ncbi:TRAP transporter large permease [Nocardiopsis sp. HNM0947]|uniref:TRAP transporter large permease n=1 Tax=Nocardiopsis coralli TaxID=2772213 RepID=A0ABR9P6B1_9ACTN|nr:TRAP transporter large permease [Nocardiopsis coralli]MBE2999376.1 TRAP transporter large permease [Nocardiopsis coralli]